MFGTFTGPLLRNWILFMLTALMGVVTYAGYNSITRTHDFALGLAETWETYGGSTLLLALGGIVLIAFIVYGVNRLQNTTYIDQNENKKQSHLIVAVVAILVIVLLLLWATQFILANLSSVITVVVFLVITFALASLSLRGTITAPRTKVETFKVSSHTVR
jgi:hypothetical protein